MMTHMMAVNQRDVKICANSAVSNNIKIILDKFDFSNVQLVSFLCMINEDLKEYYIISSIDSNGDTIEISLKPNITDDKKLSDLAVDRLQDIIISNFPLIFRGNSAKVNLDIAASEI